MQLDLFTHGRDVMLRNDVIAALRERDAASGQKALERFAAEFPDRETILSLKTLLAELAVPASRITDGNGIAARIREIDAVVTPAAEQIRYMLWSSCQRACVVKSRGRPRASTCSSSSSGARLR